VKKIYWVGIAISTILIIAVCATLVFLKKETKETKVKQENVETDFQVSVIPISQKDSFYNIQVEYPQFKSANQEFNDKISRLILSEINNFKKDAKNNWEARRATTPSSNQPLPENPPAPFDFIASWIPTQLNQKYISFIINIYYFTGGAHGVTETDAFNYDVKNNKEIAISDFIKPMPQALESLAQLASQEVRSQLEGKGVTLDENLKQMIEDGTKPTLQNYANFNFNNNFLTIYFEQYQVAPGYIGPVTVTLYKDTLTQNSVTSDYLK